MDRDKIREAVYSESTKIAPGLIYALDVLCLNSSGRMCVDLLLDDPKVFLEMLRRVYDNDDSVKLVIEIVFEKPLSRFGLKVREILKEVEHG